MLLSAATHCWDSLLQLLGSVEQCKTSAQHRVNDTSLPSLVSSLCPDAQRQPCPSKAQMAVPVDLIGVQCRD